MRTTRLTALCLLGAGLLANAGPALSAGDAKRGMNTFTEECGVCHSPKQGKAKLGPPLFGVVGRAAAAAPDFTYSDAMKRSGITWSPDKLDAYIAKVSLRLFGTDCTKRTAFIYLPIQPIYKGISY